MKRSCIAKKIMYFPSSSHDMHHKQKNMSYIISMEKYNKKEFEIDSAICLAIFESLQE